MISDPKPTSIAVVLVIKNEAERLAEVLFKVLPHFSEIIVIDNHSEDGVQEVAKDFPQVHWHFLKTPLTRGHCWNLGASFVQSDAILFLHADAHFETCAMQALKQKWINHRLDYSCFHLSFPESSLKYRCLEQFSNFRSRYLRIIYGDQGLCVHKKVFHQVGGFPNEYLLEDLKISQKLRSYRFGWIDQTLFPSTRKFKTQGFWRYLLLMNLILFLNGLRLPTKTLYRLYYQLKSKGPL